ncbi:hypothetical protein P1X14_07425 [Sphingomonas sp. AOB5]|uniref:hypothetical protein n=1 Tax=Sphingomonas sp. AOB5 TaxID=3034017 RepID=UPI0023F75A7B|nr:hypothetical protein [Sphingomonas sp. AOB5]MDF7775071.1 hypothetical protein [Sphingomonas sp. AOB5]
MKPADLRSERATGIEPGMVGPALPDASPAELRAAMVWNLRAALNVAALQCEFEPTLLTRDNYNAILRDHSKELSTSYATLERYFIRMEKNNKKAGQTSFDRFNTRVYSGFSTVSAQLSFCTVAGDIGHDALFLKPGTLGELAHDRMRELRRSLSPWGEQQFLSKQARPLYYSYRLPDFANVKCWKKDEWVAKKCGPVPPLL